MESKMTVDKNGNKVWNNSNGKLHRVDGPAIEYADGTKEWWLNDNHYDPEEMPFSLYVAYLKWKVNNGK